jgi:soluble lytic murein transglycosylase
MRMAQLLGGADLLIGRARKAVVEKAGNARALLEAVPESARGDAGYLFHKAQWLRREDKPIEAARLLQAAPRNASQQHNLDEWWVERRLVARKLLDLNENQAAYQVARDALPPTKENLRAEHEFTAGWIALRFVDNPKAAYQHFARVGEGTANPITLARGEYWQGRAAETLGRNSEARTHYQAAAQHSTAYYGQIARARLGMHCAVRRTWVIVRR